MLSKIDKVQNDLQKVDSMQFLRIIGIKNVYIKRFTEFIKKKYTLKPNLDNLFNFRLYMKYMRIMLDIPILRKNTNTLQNEINMFREYGFTKIISKYYVNSIKDIYMNDSTENWIYRIIESLTTQNGFINYHKFLKTCLKVSNNEG